MNILDKLLKKRGIESVDELNDEEKKQYREWNEILSKETLTIKDIENFCQSQIDVIEGKWSDLNLEQSKKAEYIPYHTVYKLLLNAINSPKVVREQLEAQLNNLIQ